MQFHTLICIGWMLGFAIFVQLPGCSPERDNPLDPNSPIYFPYGYVQGEVRTLYAPNSPIHQATINIPALNLRVDTDMTGQFCTALLPIADYLLVADHESYAPDSFTVMVSPGDTSRVTFYLNGLPTFSAPSVTTHYYEEWWPDDNYLLQCQVTASDMDGLSDLDSVFIEIPAYSIKLPMNYLPGSGHYALTLTETTLTLSQLHNLIGSPLFFSGVDQLHQTNHSAPVYPVRVIEQTPEHVYPALQDTVGATIELRWESIGFAYHFTFAVEIYRVDFGIETYVWGRNEIPPIDFSTDVAVTLESGIYYWRIFVVDQYGNSRRSPKGDFYVEDSR